MKTIAFFNWKGGVTNTTLATHSCIYSAERGLRAVAENAEADLAAWSTKAGARSPGARAIQQFTEDVLGRVGLASMLTRARALPRFAGPMPSLYGGRDLRARMTSARPRLQAYFDGPPSAA